MLSMSWARGYKTVFMLNSADHEHEIQTVMIKTEIAKHNGNFRFKSPKLVICFANKCQQLLAF